MDMFERLVLLPLTGGCFSPFGTEVLDQRSARRSRLVEKGRSPRKQEDDNVGLLDDSTKSSAPGRFIVTPKSNISYEVQKLLKNVKSISQLFADKDEIGVPDLRFGQPTNIKHVTHIGWNGSNLVDGWEVLSSNSQDLLINPLRQD